MSSSAFFFPLAELCHFDVKSTVQVLAYLRTLEAADKGEREREGMLTLERHSMLLPHHECVFVRLLLSGKFKLPNDFV